MFSKSICLILFFFTIVCQAQELSDPTRPQNAQGSNATNGTEAINDATGITSLRLSAIFKRRESTLAVINGQSLSKGDSIRGAIVTEIGINSVTLNIADELKTLYLVKQTKDIKSDVSNHF